VWTTHGARALRTSHPSSKATCGSFWTSVSHRAPGEAPQVKRQDPARLFRARGTAPSALNERGSDHDHAHDRRAQALERDLHD
jgi:hypothetical protein